MSSSPDQPISGSTSNRNCAHMVSASMAIDQLLHGTVETKDDACKQTLQQEEEETWQQDSAIYIQQIAD
jgi:hypothetical protein